jgi:hypothetical protein
MHAAISSTSASDGGLRSALRSTPAAFSRHGLRGMRSSSTAVLKSFSSRQAFATVTCPMPYWRREACQVRTDANEIRFSAVAPKVG